MYSTLHCVILNGRSNRKFLFSFLFKCFEVIFPRRFKPKLCWYLQYLQWIGILNRVIVGLFVKNSRILSFYFRHGSYNATKSLDFCASSIFLSGSIDNVHRGIRDVLWNQLYGNWQGFEIHGSVSRWRVN